MKIQKVITLVIFLLSLILSDSCKKETEADNKPPAELTDVSAVSGNGQVTLNWIEPSDADFKLVEVTYAPNGLTPIEVLKGTALKVITGLSNGSEITFTLKTVDVLGNKSIGTILKATPDGTAPSEVSNLKATTDEGKSTLTWTDPTDADFQKVEISYLTNTIEVLKGVQAKEIVGLINGTLYNFSVKTIDKNGNKSNGLQVSAVPTLLPNFGNGSSGTVSGYTTKIFNTNGSWSGNWYFSFGDTYQNIGGTGQIEISSCGYSEIFTVKQNSKYKLIVSYNQNYGSTCLVKIGARSIGSGNNCSVTNITFNETVK
jgi:hypothetical protein